MLRWWADGELAVAGRLDQLPDDALGEPSRLPDWSRAHVVAHLARNADALVNLLTWARTGVETPMYPSREARDADIATTAAQTPDRAARRLRGRLRPPRRGHRDDVRRGVGGGGPHMQGKTVPATDVPWMRAKEIWVHGVDLDGGLTFADAPADFCTRLVDDVLGLFADRDQAPEVTVVGHRRRSDVGEWRHAVEGPVSAVAAWLTRGDASGLTGEVPPPPRWL